MPQFSKKSAERLATCHPDLQRLFNEVIKERDIIIICGHRGKVEQDLAVKNGTSKTPFPKSKHNSTPSNAVDVAPAPLNWNNKQGFIELNTYVKFVAAKLGIAIRWGGDFNMDGNKTTNDSWDLPHYELLKNKK